MTHKEKTFRFKVAVGIILRQLREEKSTDGKPLTQNSLNNEILLEYKKTWNSAREESLPNSRLDNLFLISDFFGVPLEQFFRKVSEVTEEEINQEIRSKSKLQKLYRDLRN